MPHTLRIEPLRREHAVDEFDCGSEPLNRFLLRFALQNQQANASRTYVGLENTRVVGFYSLAFGQVEYSDAPLRLTKGVARHPVPVMLLARLAVDRSQQGRGRGGGLLKDAMVRTSRAAQIAGLRALLVHAKDEDAQRFYAGHGFDPSATDPHHMFLPLKDLRAIISRANPSV